MIHRLRLVVPCLVLSAGCAGILGIPSDVDRAEADASTDATPPSEAGPDGPTGTDGGVDAADVNVDAADTAPPPECNLTKDFGAPVLLDGVNTADQEGSPHLSDDELTIYFDGIRPGSAFFALLTATRPTRKDPFGVVTPIPGDVNSDLSHEFAPNVTSDGKTIFFERQDPNTLDNDFWFATRNALGDPFNGASRIGGINTPQYEGKLNVPVDDNEIYFSKKTSETNFDIYVAKKQAGGSYAINIVTSSGVYPVNSPQNEFAPVVAKNGLVIFFASQRPDNQGRTDENIWQATRASVNDPFGPASDLKAVNVVGANEEPGWISNDGCRLYFHSDRAGVGKQDLYMAARPK